MRRSEPGDGLAFFVVGQGGGVRSSVPTNLGDENSGGPHNAAGVPRSDRAVAPDN